LFVDPIWRNLLYIPVERETLFRVSLRILLALFGLIFTAAIYPLITSVRSGWQTNKEDSLPMGLSLYVTMGIFMFLAARNPSANRGVIVFAAWLNIAHATVMTVMAVHLPNERQDLLIASAVFAGIGAVLILLAPGKKVVERVSAAAE
jgi:hypothetical protein